MSDFITCIKQQFEKQNQHDDAWLKEKQQQAFEHFSCLGLPTRKVERWKYTSLEALKKTQFDGVAEKGVQDTHDVIIQDGCVLLPRDLPDGVTICDIFTAFSEHPHLLLEPDEKEAFALLNLALLSGGVFIHVAKNTKLLKPIEVKVRHSNNALMHHLHHVYLIEEGAEASIIESYQSEATTHYLHNVISTLFLKKNANVTYYKVLAEGEQASHIGKTHLKQEKDAKACCHTYSFDGGLLRSEVAVDLTESGTECYLNGLYVLGENQHVENYTSQNHISPDARSEESYKGIIGGNAKAVFNGSIRVEKGAQKSNASLENKNILLSKKASVDTKPQLEIFADDVKCAHGTTVGQLDEKALFYLRSRGISLSEARELLVHAFAGDLLDKVHHDVLKTDLEKKLNDKLRKVA